MRISINGQAREFPELDGDPSLARLVAIFAMKADRIAVECNGEIVSRADWTQTALREDDKLEIVQFVGGGL